MRRGRRSGRSAAELFARRRASSLRHSLRGNAPRPPAHRPNPRVEQYRRTWYLLRQNTLALIGLAVLIALVGVAIYALTQPIPYYQLTQYCATNQANGAPSDCLPGIPSVCTYPSGSVPPGPGCYETPKGYPSVIAPTVSLGTLSGGPLPFGSLTLNAGIPYFYSIYSGVVRGADWSLLISSVVVGSGALVGLTLGGISGYFGGLVDEVVMRIVDIFLSIPGLLLIIIFVAVLYPAFQATLGLSVADTRLVLLLVGFLVTWWPFYARVVRGQVLVVREQKYVEAAKASGARAGTILRRHILPNSTYPVWIQVSLDVGTVPLTIATINFLGFVILPSQYFPEWGALTALSVFDLEGFLTACQVGLCVIPWWQLAIPGLVVFLYTISLNFVSDGLRDALDPRLRR